ncbi:teleost multiple tissue opsin b [Pimephales promelas]|nr:teleost multiple tissue opsin b [Pimephales promelas]
MCTTPQRGSSFKNSSKVTKTLRTVRRANGQNVTFAVASAGHPTICAPHSGGPKSSSEGEKPSPGAGQPTNRPVVSLVAYYNDTYNGSSLFLPYFDIYPSEAMTGYPVLTPITTAPEKRRDKESK